MAKARHLHIVDATTGETLDACPTCVEWQKKYNGLLSQLAKLRADKEAEAKANTLWPQAIELFEFWKLATTHRRARWTVDRFELVEPFLRREGMRDCRRAICGLCGSDYHMKRNRHKDRRGPKYDEFERVFESQGTFERWRDSLSPPPPETQEFFQWIDSLPG